MNKPFAIILLSLLILSGCQSLKRDTTILFCFGPCSVPVQGATQAPSPPAAASAAAGN